MGTDAAGRGSKESRRAVRSYFWLILGLNTFLLIRGLTATPLPSRMPGMLGNPRKDLLLLIEEESGRKPPSRLELLLHGKNAASAFAYHLVSAVIQYGQVRKIFDMFHHPRISPENPGTEVIGHLVREARLAQIGAVIISRSANAASPAIGIEADAVLKNDCGIDVNAPPPPQPPHALHGPGVTQPANPILTPYGPQQTPHPHSGIQPPAPQSQPSSQPATQGRPPSPYNSIKNYRPKKRKP